MIATIPYTHTSNYIRKLSEFSEGEWCRIWDALYWRFIYHHMDLFSENPRLKVMVYQIGRMGKERIKEHLAVAHRFLERL